jgi:hypothetical protein
VLFTALRAVHNAFHALTATQIAEARSLERILKVHQLMERRHSLAVALAGLLVLARPGTSLEPSAERAADSLELGRRYTTWFFDGRVTTLWQQFAPGLRRVFGTPDGLMTFRQKVREDAGREVEVLNEQLIPWMGSTIYGRTARFSDASQPIRVVWTIDRSGMAVGLTVQPAAAPAASNQLDYRTRTPLQLPFRGEWFVFWGGRTVLENYHASSTDQRFANDFVIARSGATHLTPARNNEDYHCFGESVLAPAEGTIVAAVDDVADNRPGQMNERQPLGNHVILDHGNGEFSFVAHLQHQSLAVAPGDRVAAGVPLGRCGNSGRSSEPHVHYHLQTSPEFGAGTGLPAQFQTYCANGELILRGEPSRGQTIAPGINGCSARPGLDGRRP